MDANGWLAAVERAVCSQLEGVDASRADEETLTLAVGTRGVVLHTSRGVALLAPSFAAGGTIASRLTSRVQHLDPTSYALGDGTVSAAAEAVIAHLRPA
jgi:hypothetical protein